MLRALYSDGEIYFVVLIFIRRIWKNEFFHVRLHKNFKRNINMELAIDSINSRQRVVLSVLPRKYDFLMELLQNFDFVKVEHENTIGDTREEIIDNLKQAAKELKLVLDGKIEGRPARELINEL